MQESKGTKQDFNDGAGANVGHLGAVGWQHAGKQGHKISFQQRGWSQRGTSWGCRLATCSKSKAQNKLLTTGLEPTCDILGL